MSTSIPDHWKKAVRGTLASNPECVLLRQSSGQDWSDMFPGAFNFEIFTAIEDALENPNVEGTQVTTMKEPGEVWEFIFQHESHAVYTKVNLCADRTVIIYSAH